MSLMSALVSIMLIVASKDANVEHRDARSAVLVRLKFRASVKQKSGVVMQKLQNQNSLMAVLDTSLSTRSTPTSTSAIVPVNRHLVAVTEQAVTLQQQCTDWKVFRLRNNYRSDNGR